MPGAWGSGRAPSREDGKCSYRTLALTLQVAAVGTAINLPLALIASWLLVKREFPGRFLLDVLVSLPLAIPPVAIGFFMLILLSRDGRSAAPCTTCSASIWSSRGSRRRWLRPSSHSP